jgi:hypothetical protein
VQVEPGAGRDDADELQGGGRDSTERLQGGTGTAPQAQGDAGTGTSDLQPNAGTEPLQGQTSSSGSAGIQAPSTGVAPTRLPAPETIARLIQGDEFFETGRNAWAKGTDQVATDFGRALRNAHDSHAGAELGDAARLKLHAKNLAVGAKYLGPAATLVGDLLEKRSVPDAIGHTAVSQGVGYGAAAGVATYCVAAGFATAGVAGALCAIGVFVADVGGQTAGGAFYDRAKRQDTCGRRSEPRCGMPGPTRLPEGFFRTGRP